MSGIQRVACFEFPVFQGVFPLASGYLEATATLNPKVAERFEFQKFSFRVGSPEIEQALEEVEADVYTFSCYVWNMGLVKRLLPPLFARRPNAHVILGGPQVMNKPDLYLKPEFENLVLCNGEGEHTFAAYLAELAADEPDLTRVKGLCFYRDGEVITTPVQDRVRDLDEVPSPYLGGYIDASQYSWAVIETNRGCPFKCTYCYWGAATNAKVHKYSEDRVLDEITWLSKNRVLYIFIADANFGMLKRDVEIAQHIADCKRDNGYPMSVYFSSSKNTPERVTEITSIFDSVGLIATQPISLQTMSADTLKEVKRSNIRSDSYTALQQKINEQGLSSFLEMIWPLPGETLNSFRTGLGELCSYGADSFIVYPLLLINNVEMDNQRDEHGFVAIDDPDPNSEAQIVIATKDVSNADYLEGLRFSYHLTSLYSLRGLRKVATYLDKSGKMPFHEFLTAFSGFCKSRPGHPYTEYIERTISAAEQYKYSSMGGILHIALHASAAEFDTLLFDFMQSLSHWQDDRVRFLFELDLLNRPYVYRNTQLVDKASKIKLVRVEAKDNNGFTVSIPSSFVEMANQNLGIKNGGTVDRMKVSYRTSQLPFMKAKTLEDNYAYCQDKLHKMESILPQWSAA